MSLQKSNSYRNSSLSIFVVPVHTNASCSVSLYAGGGTSTISISIFFHVIILGGQVLIIIIFLPTITWSVFEVDCSERLALPTIPLRSP